MPIIPVIKSIFQNIPEPVGGLISKIPYQNRPGIGRAYRESLNEIEAFNRINIENKKIIILSKIREIVKNAIKIPFYKEIYAKKGIVPEEIRDFSQIEQLPVITKEMLKDVPLNERSFSIRGRYLENTGGSTGSTLSFYILPKHIPVEWAHIHTVWAKFGYRQSALKLVFAGRNLRDDNIKYDGLRNQFVINIYKGYKKILPDLRAVIRKYMIQYLHGYPSALSEFAEFCEEHAPDIVSALQRSLRGALLGSEYPAEVYRSKIERIFSVETVSWYGHSERTILAWERNEKFIYHPFQTYGYCEAIKNTLTDGWKLVGTSYNNISSPFIRYDTGDDVELIERREGILEAFRIRFGRIGEFVIDRKGVKIPLTALIYGRHHKLFNVARFIQVKQPCIGEMIVVATLKAPILSVTDLSALFDGEGLDMGITFEIGDKPILSPSGKVLLKII